MFCGLRTKSNVVENGLREVGAHRYTYSLLQGQKVCGWSSRDDE